MIVISVIVISYVVQSTVVRFFIVLEYIHCHVFDYKCAQPLIVRCIYMCFSTMSVSVRFLFTVFTCKQMYLVCNKVFVLKAVM